jgi:DNA-binding transcriptional regulator YiaG
MGKAYESDLLGVIHEMAEDLHQIGAINDARMREYDKNCLVQKSKPVQKVTKSTEIERINPVTVEI